MLSEDDVWDNALFRILKKDLFILITHIHLGAYLKYLTINI